MYKLQIENEDQSVSPGGELTFQISNENKHTDWNMHNIYIGVGDESVISELITQEVSWDYNKNLSHPRFGKIKIKDSISGRLPKEVEITAYKDFERTQSIASAKFKITRGTKGHNIYKGKYVKDIVADGWYRISCMGAPGEVCNINIKDGEHDKYDGQQPRISHHGISEKNYPGTSKLRVGEPVIFDARQLIVENNAEPNPPAGYKVEMNAVCRISSDKPIMVEPINNDHIGKKV